MSKERSKDKGGTLAGLSKSYNNNRGSNGKIQGTEDTSHNDLKKSGIGSREGPNR